MGRRGHYGHENSDTFSGRVGGANKHGRAAGPAEMRTEDGRVAREKDQYVCEIIKEYNKNKKLTIIHSHRSHDVYLSVPLWKVDNAYLSYGDNIQ